MTKGYPIFEWSPGIPIKDKYNKTQSEEDEIYSTHEDKHNDDITENGEEENSSKKRHMKMSTHKIGKRT